MSSVLSELDPEALDFWGAYQPTQFRKLAAEAGLVLLARATLSFEEEELYAADSKKDNQGNISHRAGDVKNPSRNQANLWMTAVRHDANGKPRDAIEAAWHDGEFDFARLGGHTLGPVRMVYKITPVYDALKSLVEVKA